MKVYLENLSGESELSCVFEVSMKSNEVVEMNAPIPSGVDEWW